MKKRIILGILSICVLAVLFLLYAMYHVRENTRPDDVVSRFYTSWIDAARAEGPTPFEQKLHKKSTYVSSAFGVDVDQAQKKGRDGVLCSVDAVPESFDIEAVTMNTEETRATVFVRLDKKILRVILSREDGWWRIDEVECPE